MTPATEELKEQLARLPISERAELAHYLLGTLDESADRETETAWDAELARRGAEIRSGGVMGEPAASAFARLSRRGR